MFSLHYLGCSPDLLGGISLAANEVDDLFTCLLTILVFFCEFLHCLSCFYLKSYLHLKLCFMNIFSQPMDQPSTFLYYFSLTEMISN